MGVRLLDYRWPYCPAFPHKLDCLHVVPVLSECGLFIKEPGLKRSSRFEKAGSSSDRAQKVALPLRGGESVQPWLFLSVAYACRSRQLFLWDPSNQPRLQGDSGTLFILPPSQEKEEVSV